MKKYNRILNKYIVSRPVLYSRPIKLTSTYIDQIHAYTLVHISQCALWVNYSQLT